MPCLESVCYGKRFLHDLYTLQQEDEMCDFVIECANGEKIGAHGVILAAGSPYFRAMLSHNMIESIQKVIRLSITKEIMQDIIRYLYSGEIKLNADNLMDIFRAAHELQVETLLEKCLDEFEDNISLENALDMFLLAQDFAAERLSKFSNRFLLEHLSALRSHKEFLEKLTPNVMKELLKSDTMIIQNEDTVLDFVIDWISVFPSRATYQQEFLNLIRFPYLTTNKIDSLQEPYKSILFEKIKKYQEISEWDMASVDFKRRKYENRHYHAIWQRELPDHSKELIVICSLDCGSKTRSKSANIILTGLKSHRSPKIGRLACVGQTFYACDIQNKTSIVQFDSKSSQTLNPMEIHNFAGPLTFANFQNCIILRNITCSNDKLYTLILDEMDVKLFELNFMFQQIISIEDSPSRNLAVTNEHAYLVGPGVMSVHLQSGEYEEIEEEAPEEACFDLDWSDCIAVCQQDDTLYLYYKSQDKNRKDFLKTYNLQTKQWGIAVRHGDDYNQRRRVELNVIGDDIVCTIQESPEELGEVVTIKKLLKDEGKWELIQVLHTDSCRFVGFAPVDTVLCEYTTWLSKKCRSIDPSSSQLPSNYSLQKIRQLVE